MNEIRIIGGKLRGQKLRFLDREGLRPTPNRVREMLFNWLMPHIYAKKCLDVFAGSGALGIEALSRGANRTVFLENDYKSFISLQQNVERLRIDKNCVKILNANAQSWLDKKATEQFDIIFLDPPFASNLLPQVLQLLKINKWLAPGGLIYVEMAKGQIDFTKDDNWQIIKHKAIGEVEALIIGVNSS